MVEPGAARPATPCRRKPHAGVSRMNHGTTERDLPYVEDRLKPLLGNDSRSKTCGGIVMGPRMTMIGRVWNDLRDNPTVQQTSRGGSGAGALL